MSIFLKAKKLNMSARTFICRGCLATDVDLFNLYAEKLCDTFGNILGIPMDTTDDIPPYVCDICRYLLVKYQKFRDTCHNSMQILRSLARRNELTPEVIDNIERQEFVDLQLSRAEVNSFESIHEFKFSKIVRVDVYGSDNIEKVKNSVTAIENPNNNAFGIDGNANGNTKPIYRSRMDVVKKRDKYMVYKTVDEITETNYKHKEVFMKEKTIFNDNKKAIDPNHKNKKANNKKDCKIVLGDEIPKTNIKEEKELNDEDFIFDDDIEFDPVYQNEKANEIILKTVDEIDKEFIDEEIIFDDDFGVSDSEVSIPEETLTVAHENILTRLMDGDSVMKTDTMIETDGMMKISNKRKGDECYTAPTPTKIRTRKVVKKVDFAKKSKESTGVMGSENLVSIANKNNFKLECLSKQEQIQELLERKERFKHMSHQCQICYKGFSKERAYKTHMFNHDPVSGKFPCGICGVRFKKNRYKWFHQRNFHKYRFLCNSCGKVYKSEFLVKEHFARHNGLKCACEICGRLFNKIGNYYAHKKAIHKYECDFACSMCDAVFLSMGGYLMHIRHKHKQAIRCYSCKIYFETKEALAKHLEGSTDGVCDSRIRACAHCGEGYNTVGELEDHKNEKHTVELHYTPRARAGRGRPPGGGAGRGRPPGGGAGGVTGSGPYMCEACGQVFIYLSSFNYHKMRHTGAKPHPCELCPKSFRNIASLRTHMYVHTDERPFQCERCPAAFRQYHHRQVHMRTHTLEKPYSCPVCERAFATKGNMQVHLRTVHQGYPKRRRDSRKRNET